MSGTSAPPWLADFPEIGALLAGALDHFDRQPGAQRQRPVFLAPDSELPSLQHGGAQADQLWRLVEELARLGVLEIRPGRRHRLDPEWTFARLAFPPASEPVLRAWLGRQPKEPALQAWRRAVQERQDAFPGGAEALLARRVEIAGRSAAEVVGAFAGIARLAGPITLRQLSATVFWGDSKLLDERGPLIAALFPQLLIRERTMPVSVFLPQPLRGVLFVENQDCYTQALEGVPQACAGLALVYASGFRVAARDIRERRNIVLHYAGPGVAAWQEPLERWWLEQGPAPGPVWFWGDLDFAGMQILKALRERFAAASAWQPGYEPMLAALQRRGGHHGASPAGGEDTQTDPLQTGCRYADEVLLPAIRQHGRIDQELVSGMAAAAAPGAPGPPGPDAIVRP
jgi:hypothetical protein